LNFNIEQRERNRISSPREIHDYLMKSEIRLRVC